MHYYRPQNSEVSCFYKYLMFSYNILFWLAGAGFIAIGFWAWSEKGMLSDLTQVTRTHGLDPVWLVLIVGSITFILGFAGCVGALRENICLLKFFSGLICLIFLLEIVAAVLAFIYKDSLKEWINDFFLTNIKAYRDDIDLQNVIDSLQRLNSCCGAKEPDDWDLNAYFNCSETNPSRERCGVPFSCCISDPANNVVNTQCGYDVRIKVTSITQKPCLLPSLVYQIKHPSLTLINTKDCCLHLFHRIQGGLSNAINTRGCILALEQWLPRNMYIVAGVFIGISVLQMVGIFLARALISDIMQSRFYY